MRSRGGTGSSRLREHDDQDAGLLSLLDGRAAPLRLRRYCHAASLRLLDATSEELRVQAAGSSRDQPRTPQQEAKKGIVVISLLEQTRQGSLEVDSFLSMISWIRDCGMPEMMRMVSTTTLDLGVAGLSA